jgi:hypothetical protein
MPGRSTRNVTPSLSGLRLGRKLVAAAQTISSSRWTASVDAYEPLPPLPDVDETATLDC